MYRVNPQFRLPDNVDLPDCMYRASPVNPAVKLAPISSNYINGLVDIPDYYETGLTGQEPVSTGTHISKSASVSSKPASAPPSCQQLVPEDKLAAIEERQLVLINKLASLHQTISAIHEQELMKLKITLSGRLTVTTDESGAAGFGNEEFVDVVINGDPRKPPYSVLFFNKLLQQVFGEGSIVVRNFAHSSATSLIRAVDRKYLDIFNVTAGSRNARTRLTISVIWKKLNQSGPELIVTPTDRKNFRGEADIVRYFSRILPAMDSRFQNLNYDGLNPSTLEAVDQILDGNYLRNLDSLESHLNGLNKKAENKIGQVSEFVVGGTQPTIADFVLYSELGHQLVQKENEDFLSKYTNVLKWLWSLQEFSGLKLFSI